VIGDTVNVAARLEQLTRRVGFDLVVSEDLVSAVRREGGEAALAGLVQGEAVPLRGRHGMVPIWMHHKAPEGLSQTIP
jgi:adenylate cyclase